MRIASDSLQDISVATADKTSEIVDVSNMYGFAVIVNWTSTTAAATIKLQLSTDPLTTAAADSLWTDHATTYAINNDNGTQYWNIDAPYYLKFRVFLDYTSGSVTTFKSRFSAKGN
jgi:hypothetical protein